MKIRIAVAVDASQQWYALGASSWDACDLKDDVLGEVRDDIVRHVVFVEADVPLPPEQVVVQGEVVQ